LPQIGCSHDKAGTLKAPEYDGATYLSIAILIDLLVLHFGASKFYFDFFAITCISTVITTGSLNSVKSGILLVISKTSTANFAPNKVFSQLYPSLIDYTWRIDG
jgi:hypothetical protein